MSEIGEGRAENLGLKPSERILEELRTRIGQAVPDDVSLVDELIAERRSEAFRSTSR